MCYKDHYCFRFVISSFNTLNYIIEDPISWTNLVHTESYQDLTPFSPSPYTYPHPSLLPLTLNPYLQSILLS